MPGAAPCVCSRAGLGSWEFMCPWLGAPHPAAARQALLLGGGPAAVPPALGLADSLWQGDRPARPAATYAVTACTGRAALKGGDVWLGSACSGARSGPCTVISLSTSVFFPIYVSFFLSLLFLLLFNVVFSAVITSLLCNVAACPTPPAPGCLQDQHCKQVVVSLNSKVPAEIAP